MTQSIKVVGQTSIEAVGSLMETRIARAGVPLATEIVLDPHAPPDLQDVWRDYAQIYSERDIPLATRSWVLPNCIVVPPEMLLVSEDGMVVSQSVRKPQLLARDRRFAHLLENGAPSEELLHRVDAGQAFILSASQHMNYYHWLVESVPRVDWARRSVDISMLMPRKHRGFHLQSLEMFGVSQDHLSFLSEPTKFREVVFVEHLARSNVRLSPLIGDFFASAHPMLHGQSTGQQRILVSRRDAKMRRVLNEDALLKALGPLGFEVVVPGDLTVREQAQTFANADFIVGIHGAGLANLVFCRPGTTVVEILPSSFREGITSFAALCELFGLRHTFYIGLAADPENGASSNVYVDVARLEEMVRAKIQRP